MQAATAGRLNRKMPFQSSCSISQPPVIAPIATPSPAAAAQIAIAFGRLCAGSQGPRGSSA
jgi:hypothetical protein